MAVLYGRDGHLTSTNGGFRPGAVGRGVGGARRQAAREFSARRAGGDERAASRHALAEAGLAAANFTPSSPHVCFVWRNTNEM
jgi:hypothetical protein